MARLISGTYVRDSLAPVLNDGTAITSKTTTTGSAVEVSKPGLVKVVLTTGTMAGSSGTADVVIQGCDSSGFGSNVKHYGAFKQLTEADDDVTRTLSFYCNSRYLRHVTVTGGTTVTSFPITVKVRTAHDRDTSTESG